MVVYVEYVIIDNMVLTYCIACIAYRLAGVRVRKLRALLAAVIGTGVAFGYPFLPTGWAVAVKVALAAALSVILFGRRAVRGGLYFLLVTAAFGGALFGIGYLCTASVRAALLAPLDIPAGLIVGAGGALYLVFRRAVRGLHRRARTEAVRLTVTWRGITAECETILDTGNNVTDGKTGLPVVVLTARTTVRLLSDEELTAFLLGRCALGRPSVMAGAGGRQKILLLEGAVVTLYTDKYANILDDVTPGLSMLPSRYGAIVHPAAIRSAKPV